MSFRYHAIGALIQNDPEAASKRLGVELGAHGGNQSETARAMGLPLRTLTRWMARVASLGFPVTPAKKDVDEKDMMS